MINPSSILIALALLLGCEVMAEPGETCAVIFIVEGVWLRNGDTGQWSVEPMPFETRRRTCAEDWVREHGRLTMEGERYQARCVPTRRKLLMMIRPLSELDRWFYIEFLDGELMWCERKLI